MSKNGLTMLVLAPETGNGRLYVLHRTSRYSGWVMEDFWDGNSILMANSSDKRSVGFGMDFVIHQFAISHDGSTIVYADAVDDPNTTNTADGIVKVYTRSSTGTWSQRGNTITGTGIAESMQMESSMNLGYEAIYTMDNIALNGDGTVLAGGDVLHGTSEAGKARVWDYNTSTNTWDERATHSDMVGTTHSTAIGSIGDEYGRMVRLDHSGDILTFTGKGISATLSSGHSARGLVRTMTWSGSAWTTRGTVTAADVVDKVWALIPDLSTVNIGEHGGTVDMSPDGMNIAIASLANSSQDGVVTVWEFSHIFHNNSGTRVAGTRCIGVHAGTSTAKIAGNVHINSFRNSVSQSVLFCTRANSNTAPNMTIKRIDYGTFEGHTDEGYEASDFTKLMTVDSTRTFSESSVTYLTGTGTNIGTYLPTIGVDQTFSDVAVGLPTGAGNSVGRVVFRDFQSLELSPQGENVPGYTTTGYPEPYSNYTNMNNKLIFVEGGTTYNSSISSPHNEAGYVRVMEYSTTTNTWTQKGNVLTGSGSKQYLGLRVDISNSGNVLHVLSLNSAGATTDDYVGTLDRYEYNSSTNTWTKTGSLGNQLTDYSAYGISNQSQYSYRFSDDHSLVIIGYNNRNSSPSSNYGIVEVFEWKQHPTSGSMYYAPRDILGGDTLGTNGYYNELGGDYLGWLGHTVNISGDGSTIAIGYINTEESGAFCILRWNSTQSKYEEIDRITEDAAQIVSGGPASNFYGFATNLNYNSGNDLTTPGVWLSGNGNTIVVNDYQAPPVINTNHFGTGNQGAVFAYEYNSSTSSYDNKGTKITKAYPAAPQTPLANVFLCHGLDTTGTKMLISFVGLSVNHAEFKGATSASSTGARGTFDSYIFQVVEWNATTGDWEIQPQYTSLNSTMYAHLHSAGMTLDGDAIYINGPVTDDASPFMEFPPPGTYTNTPEHMIVYRIS